MKKSISLICLCLVLTVGYVQAQTSQGSMMLGGGVSITNQSFQSNSDVGTSSISFSPSFGYFVADNFVVGASVTVGSSTNDSGATKTKVSSFAFGPFARYYKFTANENFAFFLQAGVNVGSSKTDQTPGGELKSGNLTFALSPGFSYFFTKHWALDLQLEGLSISSTDPNKDNDDDKYTNVNFGLSSFNPTLGFRYHFGGN